MATKDQAVVPVPITEEASGHLAKLIEATGLKQSVILRTCVEAALRALMKNGKKLSIPLYFRVIEGDHTGGGGAVNSLETRLL